MAARAPATLTGLARRLFGARPAEPSEAQALLTRADAARDARRFRAAADAYGAFLRLEPGRADIRIQCAHMAKEAGDYAAAERDYLAAQAARPDDADLALQLGHFHQTIGGWAAAEHWYARALELSPEWEEAARALATMRHLAPSEAPDGLVPELAPCAAGELPRLDHEELIVHRLGRRERGRWGVRPTLRGVEAIRGLCGSAVPLVELHILLDGAVIHREPIARGHRFGEPQEREARRKYVFNAWLDFSGEREGLRLIELRLIAAAGDGRVLRERVVIAPPLDEADHPGSDALVTLAPGDPRGVEEQVRARPSMVRPAARALFPGGVRTVLVLRTDQLGDMVASVPAMLRLRALVPGAHIVGLLTAANADLARTLGLFDEIVVVDFPDDPVERRRVMTLDAQRALRARLARYRFDIALDLAPASLSRELLQLSGARFLHGFGGGDWPWLSGRFGLETPDRWSGADVTPHSTKILAMVEALGAVLGGNAPILRRSDLARSRLERHGIGAQDRFAVLHMGARIAFSRWPGYAALAEALLARTGLTVVTMSEEPVVLPADLRGHDRLLVLAGRLDFDDLDALLSFADVFVGNDSGPKHLAALRGTNVVTLFSARIGWAEWGQENVGAIISRRVPCAGCTISHNADECGKDFACIRDIRVEEVVEAVLGYL